MGLTVDSGWEKFYTAMRYAVATNDAVQLRLANVVTCFVLLDRGHFPDDDDWEMFQKLKAETTKVPDRVRNGKGTIRVTTSQMSDDEAHALLCMAFDIFNSLAEAHGALNA